MRVQVKKAFKKYSFFVTKNNKKAGRLQPAMQVQSFPYENHCECYKKLASRSWPVLFTLTYFFLYMHSPLLLENGKVVAIAIFLTKLDHIQLFNDIYYETILV